MFKGPNVLLLCVPSLLLALFASCTYTWPNDETDMLEAIYYQQSGWRDFAMALFVQTCGASLGAAGDTGRTDSAEWFRTAYHDMATANVHAGTGGIDASIGFETERPENVGKAFNASLSVFANVQSARSSMSDLIALGTVLALQACSNGSLTVPFRAGRIDATEAGPYGVPQPQQDLKTHEAAFRKMGFNLTEMIGLVACGHTLGGVHGADFPTIVPVIDDPNNDDSRVDFDATVAAFDNSVAQQFVQNVTQNPLAFGPNVTTRSDHRIFTADGGALIGEMASSNTFFLERCSALLERMINVVPRAVTLSEPITPIPVKPVNVVLSVNSDGSFSFSGEIRVINDTQGRTVTLEPILKDGQVCASCGLIPATSNPQMVSQPLLPGMPSFISYAFQATLVLPPSGRLSAFKVQVNNETFDNGGAGFPVQDVVLVQPDSCRLSGFSASEGQSLTLNIVAAVRDDANLTSVQVIIPKATPQQNSIALKWVDEVIDMRRNTTLNGTGYTLYTMDTFTYFPGTTKNPILSYGLVGSDGEHEFGNSFYQWDDLQNFC